MSESTEPPSSTGPRSDGLNLVVNGQEVTVGDAALGAGGGRAISLLDILRDHLGFRSVKDGCSPQGQCGCCTVLVDGQARVACVTPARRVQGRSIVTLEGLEDQRRQRWAQSFCSTGASQCGFCTPGIIMRLEAASVSAPDKQDTSVVDQALLAHLCRCTGWQSITEAWGVFHRDDEAGEDDRGDDGRDYVAAGRRAGIEGRAPQTVGPEVALGQGGFAADTAPDDALMAVRAADGTWVVGETMAQARLAAAKVQGRRTTAPPHWPVELPPGEWDVALRTTWVDPAYLETDASWCLPGGEPLAVTANGGAFGGKPSDGEGDPGLDVGAAARSLADEHGRAVLAVASREDVARFGVKRPPLAAGMSDDGRAWFRVVQTPGIDEAIRAGLAAAGFQNQDEDAVVIEQLAVPGPPTSSRVRGAGWAEAAVLAAGLRGSVGVIRTPSGAEAEAEVTSEATAEDAATGEGRSPVIRVAVRCGSVLDAAVLRSYCIGAAHMAWSWLTSEALAVDASGTVHDLTVRSFGVLRAVDTPKIEVELHQSDEEPVNGSDAVFAAVAAAGWLALGRRQDWPVGTDGLNL